jgi:hypothetical protein
VFPTGRLLLKSAGSEAVGAVPLGDSDGASESIVVEDNDDLGVELTCTLGDLKR